MKRPLATGPGTAARCVRHACVALLALVGAAVVLAQPTPPAAPTTASLVADTVLALERERAALAQLRKAQHELEGSMERIARRAEVHAQGREFSLAVIEQLRQLPRAERLGADPRRNRQLEAVSDANLRVAERLAALDDIDAAVAQRMARSAPNLGAEQRADAEASLRRQLMDEQHELTGLDGLQRDLLAGLQATAKAEQHLLDRTIAAREELNRLLFWVPARPGREAVSELAPSLAWTVSAPHWAQAAAVLREQARRAPYWPAVALLAALGLAVARRPLRSRLQALAPSRRGWLQFRMRHTLLALLISLALALPGPLLLAALSGWLLRAPDSQNFALALGAALFSIARLWFGLSVIAWLLRPGGVAASHFGWDEAALAFSARALSRFAALFLPLMFVATLNGLDRAPFANRESLGRLAFMLAMCLLGGFLFHLLRRAAPPMQRLQSRAPRSWAVKWHGAWLTVVVAVPLGIALLGLAGYFIAAGYFFGRLVMTLLLVLGAVLLYGLMAQWVHLQRARLARQRSVLESQALAEPEDGEAQAMPAQRIDIAALGEQTRSLLDLLITLLLLAGVWLIWKDALPVLSVIGNYPLWTHTTGAAGHERHAAADGGSAEPGAARRRRHCAGDAQRRCAARHHVAATAGNASRRDLCDQGGGRLCDRRHRPGRRVQHPGHRLGRCAVAGGRDGRGPGLRPAGDRRQLRVRADRAG